MALRGEGLVEEDDAAASSSAASSRIVYVLHPNCAVEEY
jgi:DNA replication licensing factor MCM6